MFSSSSTDGENGNAQYSSSKEIGNPISMSLKPFVLYILAWANPNSGPSQEDRSSNAWKWVYPLGFGFILLGMSAILVCLAIFS